MAGLRDNFTVVCQVTQIDSSTRVNLELSGVVGKLGEARKVRAYCPVSFALKLAVLCLIVGLVAGVWLSSSALSTSDSSPSRPPSTRVTDGLPGQSAGEEP